MVSISELVLLDPFVLAELNRLLPQLSSSAEPVSLADFESLVASECSHLLVARDGPGSPAPGDAAVPLLGCLTLVVFRIPTGVRAWIEDVVVDEAARGHGVGEQLNLAAIELAADLGARSVDLTSRPSRIAANRLYQRLGFVARDTNVYRYQG